METCKWCGKTDETVNVSVFNDDGSCFICESCDEREQWIMV